MLTALEKGVKGGRWFSLIDKVYRPANLAAAFERVRRNGGSAGIDHVSVEMFDARREENLTRMHDELKGDGYRPSAVKRVWIPKPGSKEKRPLGIPTVRDRVVQTALRNVLEPIFEHDFAEHSYGFRPGRGCKDALRRVQHLLDEGYCHVVDADLKSYFDTIPHDRLMALVEQRVTDGRVLNLLQGYLEQDVMDGMERWNPETGSPQGAVISPLLSNIYLNPLDHAMEDAGYEMVRYADDFVILCRSREQAEQALETVRAWVEQVGLKLHPEKTRIMDVSQQGGFDFLGYHFECGNRWPTKKSEQKLRDTIRNKTRRNNGHSLQQIIAEINPILRGWFEYFKHGHPHTYRPLDGWVRMRLRSILRKRARRKGRGRGADHHQWTNAYFVEQGLFSMQQSQVRHSQSSTR
jgi:RNA-directed DNA polymerase